MRVFLRKLWFPLAVVLLAAVQTFGMDMLRTVREPLQETEVSSDTVIYDNSKIFTKFRKKGERALADTSSSKGDSLFADEKPLLSARDTIKAPDSLKFTDPFRYKYYVALVDSLTHKQVRDSLRAAGDSIDWPKLDSIYYADSAIVAKKKFLEWYNSLDKDAKKRYDFEQKMKRRQERLDSVLNVKDSLKAIKDSIKESTPRILQTFAVSEDMQFKRIITWKKDPFFNNPQLHEIDTSYNHWFNDYPFMREDVNATYLGIVGSPVQNYDAFKRTSTEKVSFYAPYEVYSYSPSTIPMYNTKTPYTELAYWGTLFANKEREESDIHIMTTQNIIPELNLRLEYNRYGANGMLNNEDTDNRTFAATANYMGKKYLAHGGYISNLIKRSENGGIVDNFWIRDTTVGSREIATRLSDADNIIKKKIFFLDQTYRIPFSFLKRLGAKRKEKLAEKDSLASISDSTSVAEINEEEISEKETPEEKKDSLQSKESGKIDTDVTTAFIGHNSEYSTYSKLYTDKIALTDKKARDFYNNNFFLNPVASRDSIRVMRLENKLFLKLQPWSKDAIVSSLNVGAGHRLLQYYVFEPDSYLKGPGTKTWNSLYIYGGVGGRLKKFVEWKADGYYTLLGQEINDIGLSADATFNIFPFRRQKNSPMSFKARFETTLDEPEFYEQHYFSNHYRWDNNFGKISTTKIEGSFEVPHWKLKIGAGYSLLGNNIYYDTLAVIRQNTSPMSVAKLSLMKNFQIWKLHFDNTALLQLSSNEEVMPLPTAALNLKWYFQIDVVKNVMQMQIGGNVTYTTAWHAPSYSPATGMFFNQRKEKYGNSPYADLFLNIQWKRACIFVKLVNANMGWPLNRADYFSAAGYIRPQRTVKFGIFWPFYLQPSRNASVSGKAGSSLGGGSEGASGAGGPGGLGGGLGSALSGLRQGM